MPALSFERMEELKLKPRLACVADLVPERVPVIDVGTDHGFLAVALEQTGNYGPITATDINPAPLASAVKTAEKYGVKDCLTFVCTPGLEAVSLEAHPAVAIAGMGGETITGILTAAAESLHRVSALILQPQSKTEVLLPALTELGFAVDTARLCRDAGKLYLILRAIPVNAKVELSPTDCYVPECLRRRRDPLLPDWLNGLILRIKARLNGLGLSGQAADEEASALRDVLTELEKMRKETETW